MLSARSSTLLNGSSPSVLSKSISLIIFISSYILEDEHEDDHKDEDDMMMEMDLKIKMEMKMKK